MKFTSIAILALAVEAKMLRMRGSPNSDMQKEHHWRERWPLGHIDAADTDAEADVLEKFNSPEEKHSAAKAEIKYPWSYDSDVLATGKSL